MGWKSTIELTRSECVERINKLMEDNPGDGELSEVLEVLLGGYKHGHNYTIVTEDQLAKFEIMEQKLYQEWLNKKAKQELLKEDT